MKVKHQTQERVIHRGDPGLKIWGSFLKSQLLDYIGVSFQCKKHLSFSFEVNFKI